MSYSEDYKIRVSAYLDRVIQTFAGGDMEKLDKEIAKLISASKLEGHDEISTLAQNMKNVSEALRAGKLLPTDTISSTLKQAMDQIRGNMEGRLQGVDSTLIANLKGLMKYAKSDERDFIFTRAINVLYVDEDDFAHVNVKKVSGKLLNIVSCYSGAEAQSLLARQKFDAVLCEMDLSDVNSMDLIKDLSGRLPVVAISASDDPRQIQIATKAGAVDYIVKNDVGILWIPRSLHTATNDWNRKKRASKKPAC